MKTFLLTITLYLVGIASAGYTVGYITGASNSPVGSSLLTGLLGILAGALLLSGGKKDKGKELVPLAKLEGRIALTGISLLVISAGFFKGLNSGWAIRGANSTSKISAPWKNSVKPDTIEGAVWLMQAVHHFESAGYDSETISDLVEIYTKNPPDVSPPLYEIIPLSPRFGSPPYKLDLPGPIAHGGSGPDDNL